MKKSRLAILIVALILICATVAISFATFEGTSGKASVTIGTGDSIGITIDTSNSMFEDEKENGKESKLIPRQAEMLKKEDNSFLNEAVSKSSGYMNKIALAGKLVIKVTGSPIDVLKFKVSDIKIGGELHEDLVNVHIFNGYSKFFDAYDFVNTGNMVVNKPTAPHYLGARWNGSQYEGGSKGDIETAMTMPVGDYEFTVLVYFNRVAADMPSLSGKALSFTLTVDAR